MFTRSKNNPILGPNPSHPWEEMKVYNPGAIYENGVYHLFYRARGKDWVSAIGHAVSEDGENFQRFDRPVLSAEGQSEKKGLEDPRVTKIGDTYFMAYAAYDGGDVRLNIATSPDLKAWTKRGKAFSNFEFLKNGGTLLGYDNGQIVNRNYKVENKEWSKSGAILPEKVGGKYWMLFGEYNIWLANSGDGLRWEVIPGVFLSPRDMEYFDGCLVEMGPPPIKTEKGWLVLYHGVDHKKTYRIGFLILDLGNPAKVIYRSSKPIFEPEQPYELSGIVDILPGGYKAMEKMSKDELRNFIKEHETAGTMPQVVFSCGAVLVDGLLRIYYGASDQFICTATTRLEEILR